MIIQPTQIFSSRLSSVFTHPQIKNVYCANTKTKNRLIALIKNKARFPQKWICNFQASARNFKPLCIKDFLLVVHTVCVIPYLRIYSTLKSGNRLFLHAGANIESCALETTYAKTNRTRLLNVFCRFETGEHLFCNDLRGEREKGCAKFSRP